MPKRHAGSTTPTRNEGLRIFSLSIFVEFSRWKEIFLFSYLVYQKGIFFLSQIAHIKKWEGQVERKVYDFQIRLAMLSSSSKKIVGGKIQFNVQLKFSSIFYLELLSFTIPYSHFIYYYTHAIERVALGRSMMVGHRIFHYVIMLSVILFYFTLFIARMYESCLSMDFLTAYWVSE